MDFTLLWKFETVQDYNTDEKIVLTFAKKASAKYKNTKNVNEYVHYKGELWKFCKESQYVLYNL